MTDILLRPFIALQVAVHELREREDGQTTTEYAILLGFLAIAIIIALFFLRDVLKQLFSDVAKSVQSSPGGVARKGSRSVRLTKACDRECAPVQIPSGPPHSPWSVVSLQLPLLDPQVARRTQRPRRLGASRTPLLIAALS